MIVMKDKIYYLIFCLWALTACTKMDHTYKPYLEDGEIFYPGVPTQVDLHTGRKRIEVQFPKNVDPNIVGYKIYWNEKKDSVVVKQPADLDSVKVIISGLEEQTYNFEIVSFDQKNNHSIEVLKSGKSYDAVYESTLLARAVVINSSKAGLILDFAPAELENKSTEVTYTNNKGKQATIHVPSSENSYTIPDNIGPFITLRSIFVPNKGIDSFYSAPEEKSYNPYSGTYQAKGVFHHPTSGDRNYDQEKVFARITDEIVQCNLGDLGSSGYFMQLKVNADMSVTITPAGQTPNIDQSWGPNYYDPKTKTFHLFYSYNKAEPRKVEETIVLK